MNIGSPLYDRIRTLGPRRVAVETVLFCLISAVVICYGVLYAFGRPFNPFAILLPILVPLIVAPPLAYLTARLIADLDSARRHAAESERSLQGIMDNMTDVFYRTNLSGRITMVSRSLTAAAGWRMEEVIGRQLSDFYDDPDSGIRVLDGLNRSGGRLKGFLVPMLAKDGTVIWTSVNAQYHYDEDGAIAGVEGMVRDVTEQVGSRKKMGRMANHDLLTGLATRRLLIEQVGSISRDDGECAALVRFDIHGFKQMNNDYGTGFCDGLVIETASRLRRGVRTDDLVARVGGDEFAVFMDHLPGVEALSIVLGKLRDEVEQPFFRDGQETPVQVSLGAVVLRDSDVDAEYAFEEAGKALFDASAAGGGRFVIHEMTTERVEG